MDRKNLYQKKNKLDNWIRRKPFILRIFLYIPITYFQIIYYIYKVIQIKSINLVSKWQAHSSKLWVSVNLSAKNSKTSKRKKNSKIKNDKSKSKRIKDTNVIYGLFTKIDKKVIAMLAIIDSKSYNLKNLIVARLHKANAKNVEIKKKNIKKSNNEEFKQLSLVDSIAKSKKKKKTKKESNIFVRFKSFLLKDVSISSAFVFLLHQFKVGFLALGRLTKRFLKKVLYVILYPFRLLKRILHAIFNFEVRIKIFHPLTILFLIVIASIYIISVFYFSILEDMPDSNKILEYDPRQTTKIYDRKGNLLYKVYQDEDRRYVKLDKIPKDLINATIAIEDKDFYKHKGLSTTGIIRAAKKTFLEEDLQGGSTITQQLVKNVLLTPDRTMERKIKEAILSVEVERKLSKDEILEMYLNTISYGGTAYGVEAAAKKYFGKELDELDLAESAYLAGLPAAPSVYSPFSGDFELGKKRQREVLQRMVEDGYITQEEADKAYQEGFIFAFQNQPMKSPHFVNYVLAKLEEKYGQQLVMQGGLDVYTSLDPELQGMLEETVKKGVNSLSKYNVHNGAAIITNPQTGEILAMVGSVNFWDTKNDGNVNVTISPRQPGSSIKPLLYSLAIESGKFSPYTKIQDSPVTYAIAGSKPYKPVNYDGRYHGTVALKTALANSYNIPAVKTLNVLGVDNFIEHAKKMGITTWNDRNRYGLSLALGAGEVKMVDMATAYGVFANGGYKKELDPILKIYDSFGFLLYENGCVDLLKENPSILTKRALIEVSAEAKDDSEVYASDDSYGISCQKEKVLSEKTAYYMVNMLSDNRARLPAFGSRNNLGIPNKKIAVKTGTTNNEKDNWAIGFAKNYLVATWIGNNDGERMHGVVSGYHGASNIWRDVFDYLIEHRDVDDSLPLPAGLVEVEICPLTNTLACEGCPNEKRIYEKGKEPKHKCSPDVVKRIIEEKEKDKEEKKDD